MTETTVGADYTQFVEKKVILVYLEEGKDEATELEGTLVAANDLGLMIKPKGRTAATIIDMSTVQDVRHAPVSDKAIVAKKLKSVEFGRAKQHLLDRHGLKLSDINRLSEQDAFDFHTGLDHKKLELGHVHVTAQEAADAVKAAQAAGRSSGSDDDDEPDEF